MPLTERQYQTLLWTGVAVAIALVLAALGPVLTPFVAAAILAYVLEPSVRWLAAHRVPRALAVTLTIVATVAAIAAIVLIVMPIVQKEFGQIRTQLPGLVATITDRTLPWLNDTFGLNVRLDTASIRTWVAEHLATSGDDLAAQLLAYLKSGSSVALQVVGLVFLVPVVLFYLLLDWSTLVARLAELVPPRWRATVGGFTAETDALLGQYLRGQALVMLALSAYYAIGLLIGGFDLWLPIGVLTGMLVVVPYLGFATGMIFALIAGMLEFGPLRGLVTVAVVYGFGQVLEGVFLTPRLVGERIGLHPLAVIMALLAFGYAFGFVGVLLALPMAAVLAVALRHLRGAYLSSDFFGRTR
jgi:predicted PurR-regulated permease PerM